jgi:hypothetical protein
LSVRDSVNFKGQAGEDTQQRLPLTKLIEESAKRVGPNEDFAEGNSAIVSTPPRIRLASLSIPWTLYYQILASRYALPSFLDFVDFRDSIPGISGWDSIGDHEKARPWQGTDTYCREAAQRP